MKGVSSPFTAFIAIGLWAPAPAAAQEAAATQEPAPAPQERIRHITVYGNDPCPPSTGEEIIVCARRPETERYRVPEGLREPEPGPEGESWAVRAESLEYVGRTGTDSCSTVGPGGFTGCLNQLIRQAREERRQAARQQQPPR